MDIIVKFVEGFDFELILKTLLRIGLITTIGWVVMIMLGRGLKSLENHLILRGREEGEPPSEAQKRIETLVKLLKQASFIAVGLTTLMILLKELGVDVAPIIASAGVVGLAVGFGAQNLVRDIISGFFIILENQIRVGDVAIINGTGGLVERIKFRTTVLRDLAGIVHVFPNGTITTLSNMTNGWSAYVFDIGVAYKEDVDKVIAIIKEVGAEMRNDPKYSQLMLEDCDVFGLDKLADSAVIIKGRLKTKPIRQWEVGREFLRRIKIAFDQQGIEIPFPHRTLYFGEELEGKEAILPKATTLEKSE